MGKGSAVTVTVVAFVAYLFGGYVAGRMARRAGLVNGLAVFVLAVLLVVRRLGHVHGWMGGTHDRIGSET